MKRAPSHPRDVSDLRSALLAHYDRSARDLPWRRDTEPYPVLVSEIMLQQTRVETVVGYYGRWLERFPSVEALADASEDEVMKAWEGLGYYRRARYLHRAAQILRERAAEEEGATRRTSTALIPSTYEELRELPGVGAYTAGAVASIAFDEVVPAVDGNVRRVLARLYDLADPKPAWLRERAGALVDPDRPGDWNQALMELGATICTPRRPDCPACPVAPWCAARAVGTQAQRPAPASKREVPSARFALAVLERDGRLLLERRPDDGLLAGLWAFPERRLDRAGRDGGHGKGGAGPDGAGAARPDGAVTSGRGASLGRSGGAPLRPTVASVARELGLTVVDAPRRLEPVRHRFSHLEATYLPEVARVEGDLGQGADHEAARDPGKSGSACASRPAWRWIDPWHDDATALPTAQRRVLEAWRESTTTSEVG